MLSNSVIIILREMLEAAMVISIFAAMCTLFELKRSYIVAGIAVGVLLAVAYAYQLPAISMAYDGIGQELLNSLMYALSYLSFFIYSLYVGREKPVYSQLATLAMLSAVALVSIREAAESMLYIGGFFQIPDLLHPVLIGSAVGVGIGGSVGILIYYFLVTVTRVWGHYMAMLVLAFISGSMISQAIQQLTQVNIISASKPVWDSSHVIAESSLEGQMLYALIGYEATPSLIQVIGYLCAISLIIIAWKLNPKRSQDVF